MTVQSSIPDQIKHEIASEGLLEGVDELNPLIRNYYGALVESDDAFTADDGAHWSDSERSAASGSIQQLVGGGLSKKEQSNRHHMRRAD